MLSKPLILLPVLAAGLVAAASIALAQDSGAQTKNAALNLGADASFVTRKDSVKDGSSSVTYGTRLPTSFETKIGVDMGASASQIAPDPDKLVSRTPGNGNSGSAWATMSVPIAPLGLDASSNAKLDSAQDQSRVGIGVSRKLSINDSLQMRLKSDYGVTNSLPAPPSPGTQSVGTAAQTWETKRAVEFDLLRTNTAITAGEQMATGEDKWLRSLSAEQKIYGPLSITGGVAETATGGLDKTFKAGFKKTW